MASSFFIRIIVLTAVLLDPQVLSFKLSKIPDDEDGPSTTSQPGFRAGKCPVFEAPPECPPVQENYCSHDSDCSAKMGLKCCNTGCDLDCVGPDDEDGPLTTSQLQDPDNETDSTTTFKKPTPTPTQVQTTAQAIRENGTAILAEKPTPMPTQAPTPTQVQTRPAEKFRAGKCPIFEAPPECPPVQENYCSHDSDCPADMGLKCCNTGCELDCVVPDDEDGPSKTSQPGFRAVKCPIFEAPAECPPVQENYCSHDNDCPAHLGLKCCNTGCELDCVVPDDEVGPSTTSQARIRAGKCPVFKPPAECSEEQENYCSHDRDCADVGQKCCNTGCILDCVDPDNETDPTTTSEKPTPTPTQVQTTALPVDKDDPTTTSQNVTLGNHGVLVV